MKGRGPRIVGPAGGAPEHCGIVAERGGAGEGKASPLSRLSAALPPRGRRPVFPVRAPPPLPDNPSVPACPGAPKPSPRGRPRLTGRLCRALSPPRAGGRRAVAAL